MSSGTITEEQMTQLRRLGVGTFVIYKAGIEAKNFGSILSEAAEGFSTRHQLPLDVTEALLGHVLSELTRRDWALVVLRRNGRYVSGAIMSAETVSQDEAVIQFVREGLSQVPMDAASGEDGEMEIFGGEQ